MKSDMSLKAVHIFFIVAASALVFYMGVWCLQQGKPEVWAYAAFASFVILGIYLLWFLRKSKGLR